ncbi:pyruvate dehydrogenase (acetyl-transferring), homodimeric type [Acidithrix sp. C25]|uniref:pyruvate dehydrogenase (acetyl-transferring), homodimeric type n=1 Tax=Acidithrix sp. C25 TaxID=1671482 RepID=UPI001BCF758E|nr:pyruvate dehydrogenase (acetyl-transferring), homodimeric type [Acidithrix sp. C25]
MIIDGFSHQIPDIDPQETTEWVDSFNSLVDGKGKSRASYILLRLLEAARSSQVGFPATVSTPYINSIPPEQQPWFPGDEEMERQIRRYIRWNAAVMVTRANMKSDGIGGHLATYASSATLYEVGFNHFFKGKSNGGPGDQVFFQGHASPGIYSRAFVEGRLSEAQLDNYRMETGGNGLPSYPHPRCLPDFWEFPTVSMGIGPLTAINQAYFNRYLQNRQLCDTSESTVWAFVGDGEFDEPETTAGLSLAGREKLDNLVMVVNCNLQRLDGPVRGNGKIIQELEATLRGSGWNVIKVIWGSAWDELLARDIDGVLLNKMNSTCDGEFQKLATETGAYIREHFFGPDPRLRRLVEHLSDDELVKLPRGGHDYKKLYAAYKAATEHSGAPTAILAKTVKGWTLGSGIEARNATHQIKKMSRDQLLALRETLDLDLELPDSAFETKLPPYIRPKPGSDVYEYMIQKRRSLGGNSPSRTVKASPLPMPAQACFKEFYQGSGRVSASTTMAFAKLLKNLVRDPSIGNRVVPIIPDEARTFGLESLIKDVKIYASQGQRYTPVDAGLLLSYEEGVDGQILEEGITEAGSMATFQVAGTSYSTFGCPTIPFYMFYSMFGFQRTGDQIWAASDARSRGFLIGGTAGRTTLMGEGLQHNDGHSLLLASTVPSVRAYDPAFAYEMAILVEHGINEMYGVPQKDEIYYITLYNENYQMPAMPEGVDFEEVKAGIINGIYLFRQAPSIENENGNLRATILFSGTAWLAAVEAQKILTERYSVAADLYSVTSYKSLREDALETERYNRLHPLSAPRQSTISSVLDASSGPILAVSDFMKAVPDQVGRFLANRNFTPLGTDGFGRSDTRENLRRYFEIDAPQIVVGILNSLAQEKLVPMTLVQSAIDELGIDASKTDPLRTI